jgi:hypothetical protein
MPAAAAADGGPPRRGELDKIASDAHEMLKVLRDTLRELAQHHRELRENMGRQRHINGAGGTPYITKG